MGCHSLLQGVFPTPGSNPGFLHSRQIHYRLSHQGSLVDPRSCLNLQPDVFHHLGKILSHSVFKITCSPSCLLSFWDVTCVRTSNHISDISCFFYIFSSTFPPHPILASFSSSQVLSLFFFPYVTSAIKFISRIFNFHYCPLCSRISLCFPFNISFTSLVKFFILSSTFLNLFINVIFKSLCYNSEASHLIYLLLNLWVNILGSSSRWFHPAPSSGGLVVTG